MRRISVWLTEFENRPVYIYLALSMITLVAAALRFYKLGEWSFWGDEMFTISGREDGFNYSFARQSLSMMLIQTLVAYWGPGEWNARLVPALLGIVSIPVLYFPLRKMFSPLIGLAAGLLLAVSPWHLYWSQNARFYVALLLFYSLALFIFYLAIEEDRPWYLLVSLIFLGLAVKERLLALFFIPVVISYLALLYLLPFEKPRGLRWRNLLLLGLPGLIFGLLFTKPYLQNLPAWMAGFGYSNNSPFWVLASFVFYVGLPTICIGTLGAFYLLSQKSRAALLLSLGALVPLLGIMSIAPFHYTANRYTFIALTSWIILSALASVELLRQTQAQVKILAAGVLIFLLSQALGDNLLYYHYQNGNRENWKAAFEWIKAQKEEDDLVFAINPELGTYYLQDKVIDFGELDLAEIEENGHRIWFVEDAVTPGVYPDIHQWLEKNAGPVANFDVYAPARNFKLRVYFYQPTKDSVHISN